MINNSTNKIIELENLIIQEEILSRNNYDLIINVDSQGVEKTADIIMNSIKEK